MEDANFDRDAQQKRERLGELKEKTDKAAFEFATAFAQLDREITDSDRQARCASEARREAQLLTDKARQLRGTLEEQRVLVERETSETLVSDLAEFSKGIDALVPIETAALVVDLKSASNSDNHERIAQARAKLETKLRELSGFGEFRRDAEQKRLQLAQAELASAVTRARLVIDFVGEYISRNLGSDKVQPLLAINRDITGALGYENAATLTDVIAAKEVELTSLGLAQEYETFASRPDPAQPSGAHITEEAIEFLNDTQRFIGTQPAIDRIGDIALEAAALRKAIDGADPAAAQKAMARLKGMLDPVEGFSDFLQRRLEERRRELARRLAVATAEAEMNIKFVDAYLRAHIGDKLTEQLLKQKQRLSASLSSQSVDEVAKANDAFGTYLNDNFLREAYSAFVNEAGPSETATEIVAGRNTGAEKGARISQ